MKAFVVTNGYDCEDALLDLENSLKKLDINLIEVSTDIYLNPRNYLKGDEQVLFYRNPYIRFSRPLELLQFSKSYNFDIVAYFKELLIVKSDFNISKYRGFTASNVNISYYNPKIKPSPIIIVGHKRLDYFKLTLNSILFSLLPEENTPIYIGLSSPNEEYLNYCLAKSKENTNIKVFETKDNSSLAIINLILQRENPDTFLIIEEDYILPQITKYLYPYWTKQYTNFLNYFDLVSQLTDSSNLPYDFFNPQKKSESLYLHQSKLYVNKDLPSIGSGMGFKTNWYKKLLSEIETATLYDGYIKNKASNTAQLNIQGYHIGWNQEMDGFKKLSDWSRFEKLKSEYILIDHSTNTEHLLGIK